MESRELMHIGPNAAPFRMTPDYIKKAGPNVLKDLELLNVAMDSSDMNIIADFCGFAQDNLEPLVTTPSISVPIQFLQQFLPGWVDVVTQKRKIDDLVGKTNIGNWEDEEVVQGVLEGLGDAVPYDDYNNVPFAETNVNYERRTNVRFEQGYKSTPLAQARAGRQKLNEVAQKRAAAIVSLAVKRNEVGFYGYNNGANRTYGMLNDPSLPAYVPVPAGIAGFTTWQSKTFVEITNDILSALSSLRTQSGERVDPDVDSIILAVSMSVVDQLSSTNDYSATVRDWLTENYPNVTVKSAPELDGANGGQNVFYMYAETVKDSGTDDGRVWLQAVTSEMKVIGIQQLAKGFEEDLSNATAGVMLKRPYAVVRYTGI